MIISSPIASDSAVEIPSISPPRARLGSAIAAMLQRQQRELPAVVVDPLGHEHAVGRPGEKDRNQGERISARVDQPAARSAQARRAAEDRAVAARSRPRSAPHPGRRGTVEAAGSARRSAGRPAATNGCSRRTAGSADIAEDRTSPGRGAAPRTCIIRMLSSVSPRLKKRISAHLLKMNQRAKRQPGDDDDRLPVALDQRRPARSHVDVLPCSALPWAFSRCSRSNAHGKQPPVHGHPDYNALVNEDRSAQLIRVRARRRCRSPRCTRRSTGISRPM